MTKRALLLGAAIIVVALPATYFAYAATLGVSSSKVTIYKSDASIAVPSPTPSTSPTPTTSSPPVSLTGSCTLNATQDTHISEAALTASFGGVDMAVRSEKTTMKRSFLMFDPTKCVIPAGATMKTAALTLTFSGPAPSARTWAVHRVGAPWTESTTWATQPLPGALSGQVSITRNATSLSGPITADVEAMRANPALNFGWRLTDTKEGENRGAEIGIKSREASTGAPTLVISYSP